MTRRTLLGTGAAAAGLAVLPSAVRGQAAAGHRRWEITDPNIPANIIPSYKKAVGAMLALEPTDARNWYRNAIVHLLDCPHGNWWFLPWHRGYLGWFEQTCRELSGDADFALPYWDWTKTPRVPEALFQDVLDPNNAAFIPTSSQFQANFQAAVTALYGSFSADQKAQLANRPFAATEADFWDSALAWFSAPPNARGLTAADPDLDPFTQTTVSLFTIRAALRVPTFTGTSGASSFGSAKAPSHSDGAAQGTIESQPHNNVHGAIGGFMGAFLSPVDPVFFLHHGNIDRLWDVWTRRQQVLGRPTKPEGADLTAWSDEPFLFFSGADGQPVAQNTAGAYAEIGAFDYDYSPGSGEDEVGVPVAAAPPIRVEAAVSAEADNAAAGGVAQVPAAALAAADEPAAAPVVAEVTLNLGEHDMGRRFSVFVAAGAAGRLEAGTITIFGHPKAGETAFAVPLPPQLASAATDAAVAAAETVPLDIRVEEIERIANTGPHTDAPIVDNTRAPVSAIAITAGG